VKLLNFHEGLCSTKLVNYVVVVVVGDTGDDVTNNG